MKNVLRISISLGVFLLVSLSTTTARAETLTVEIVKGTSVDIPLPTKMPTFTVPRNGGDIYGLYEQKGIFWTYRSYQKFDFNKDGRDDYYLTIEATFGPEAHDLIVNITWNKISLTSEERASLKKDGRLVVGGVEGRDYEPIFYDFAEQYMKYYIVNPKRILLAYEKYRIHKSPSEGFSEVRSSEFKEFLTKNCEK